MIATRYGIDLKIDTIGRYTGTIGPVLEFFNFKGQIIKGHYGCLALTVL